MLSPKIIKLKDILLNSGKNPKFSHFDFDYNYAGCNLYKENELWEETYYESLESKLVH